MSRFTNRLKKIVETFSSYHKHDYFNNRIGKLFKTRSHICSTTMDNLSFNVVQHMLNKKKHRLYNQNI